MKITSSLFSAALIVFAVTANAYNQQSEKPLRIYPEIRFVEGADLNLFNESYSKSMGDQRLDYVDQASQLMMMGAYGEEAAKMLQDFDEHVLKIRNLGKSRLGVTLEGAFKAQLDQHYRTYAPTDRKMQFAEKTGRNNLDFDVAIYGVYSVNAGRVPGLHLTVTVVDLRTGLSQSFEADGDGISASKLLAGQVFHEVQATKFPSTARVLGKVIELVSKGFVYHESGSKMRDLNKEAYYTCESMDARLIREDELRALAGRGDYRGGITLGLTGAQNAYWALAGERVFVSSGGWVSNDANVNPSSYLNYVCVRGGTNW